MKAQRRAGAMNIMFMRKRTPRSARSHLSGLPSASLAIAACLMLVAHPASAGARRATAGTIKSAKSPGIAPPASSVTYGVVQGQPKAERARLLPLTLRSSGFDLPAITIEKGRTLLVVHNRSGVRDIGLRLTRQVGQAGERLREVKLSSGKLDWRTVVELPPGTYILSAADQPGWECRITVNEK